jgi:hypothetical protein
VFNPKDPNTFASASLDRTIKVRQKQAISSHMSAFFSPFSLCFFLHRTVKVRKQTTPPVRISAFFCDTAPRHLLSLFF